MQQRHWILTTGKGLVYIVIASSPAIAQTRLQKKLPGVHIASIVQAEEVL